MSEFIYTGSDSGFMPAMALRGLTVFPGMSVNFDVERLISLNALNMAMDSDRKIFLVTQKDIAVEMPSYSDLYNVGVVCNIRQLLKIPGGGVKVLVEGLYRAEVITIGMDKNAFAAQVSQVDIPEEKVRGARASALVNKAFDLFSEYSRLTGNVAKETVLALYNSEEPGYVADYIAQNIAVRVDKKQQVLEILNPLKRIEFVCEMMADEVEVARLEKDIDKKLYMRLGEQQRTNILREQMNVIKAELGMDAGDDGEFDEYREKIIALLVMLGAPTTPSCYIMAKNMGHKGDLTSGAVVVTTLLSSLTLTLWLFVLKSQGII